MTVAIILMICGAFWIVSSFLSKTKKCPINNLLQCDSVYHWSNCFWNCIGDDWCN